MRTFEGRYRQQQNYGIDEKGIDGPLGIAYRKRKGSFILPGEGTFRGVPNGSGSNIVDKEQPSGG